MRYLELHPLIVALVLVGTLLVTSACDTSSSGSSTTPPLDTTSPPQDASWPDGSGSGDIIAGDMGDSSVMPDIPFAYDGIPVQPDLSMGLQDLGGLCNEGDDCLSGSCYTGFAGGYCTEFCDSSSECPDGSPCYPTTDGDVSICWAPCEGNWDCRGDQFCGQGICVMRCKPGECGDDHECNLQTGKCDYSPTVCEPTTEVCDGKDNDCNLLVDENAGCCAIPALPDDVQVIDFGKVLVGGGGLTQDLKVNVPSNASSFTIVAMSSTPGYMITWYLTDPQGNHLVDANDPMNSTNRSYVGEYMYALQVPGNPQVSLSSGLYHFALYKEGEVDDVCIMVFYKLDPTPTSGTLDVNCWLVGLSGLTASTAAYDSDFQSVVSKMKGIYAQVDIDLNITGYYDITGSEGSKFTYLDVSDGEDDEMGQLLEKTASNGSSKALNVFFVNSVDVKGDYSGYYDTMGISAGIPGPPLYQGTKKSGVVVSMEEFYNDWWGWGATTTSEVAAHEMGHFLGLYHVTEQTGTMFDQIPDTPQCTSDTNYDGIVDPYECEYKGANNLMFWSVTGSVILTDGQGHVMLRNPMVY